MDWRLERIGTTPSVCVRSRACQEQDGSRTLRDTEVLEGEKPSLYNGQFNTF